MQNILFREEIFIGGVGAKSNTRSVSYRLEGLLPRQKQLSDYLTFT